MKRLVLPFLALWGLLVVAAPFIPTASAFHFFPILVPDLVQFVLFLAGGLIAAIRLFKREGVGWNLLALACILLGALSLRPDRPAAPGKGYGEFRVLTLNAKMDAKDHPRLVQLIKEERIDFVMLQENFGGETSPAEAVRAAFPGWHIHREDALALVSRWPIRNPRYTPLGRFKVNGLLEADIERPEGAFRAVNVHWEAPHVAPFQFAATREREVRLTREAIHRSKTRTLFGGDFNSPPRYGAIRDFKREFGYTAVGNTYMPRKAWPVVQLDYLWGRGIAAQPTWIGPDVGSDHLPVLAEYTSLP